VSSPSAAPDDASDVTAVSCESTAESFGDLLVGKTLHEATDSPDGAACLHCGKPTQSHRVLDEQLCHACLQSTPLETIADDTQFLATSVTQKTELACSDCGAVATVEGYCRRGPQPQVYALKDRADVFEAAFEVICLDCEAAIIVAVPDAIGDDLVGGLEAVQRVHDIALPTSSGIAGSGPLGGKL